MGAPDRVVETAWSATEKQREFLAASEFEVLFGGAAGGGKTDGMLVDAMGLSPLVEGKPAHIEKRSYQAIIFRKTYPDLKDIIDRSHEVFRDYDRRATFDKQAHVWTFPSGARIEFGYIQRDIERYRYRGRAFSYIGWEELTLWPTSAPYLYLMSRLRGTDPSIPLYVRATTNPDGPGFRWVMERWKINPSGKASVLHVDMKDQETGEMFTRSRRFIPSKVEDNPHIQRDYIANLLLLDEDDQKRLRRGLWVAPQIKGAYYAEEMQRARDGGRISKVPYARGIPVDTYWDLGLSKDSGTTAIWCGQHVSLQHRFLKCVENHSESLDWYVKWLLDTNYAFGRHFLPHDANVRRLGKSTVKSWKELLQELMPGHTFVIVKRIEDIAIGVQQTKARFDECWFDEEGCAEGISALDNYQREWDEDNQTYRNHPLHNWCFTGDTKVLTRYGMRQMMDLPLTGEVLTPCGWKPYHNPRMTRRNAQLVEVVFADGLTVRCTPDHMFMTASGWKSAESLTRGTSILSSLTRSRSITMAASTVGGRRLRTILAAANSCIGWLGQMRSALSQRAVRFITKTLSQATTHLPISNASRLADIDQRHGTSTAPNAKRRDISLPRQEIGPLYGTRLRKGVFGTAGTQSEPKAGLNGSERASRALNVAINSWRWFARAATARFTAQRHARALRIESVRPLQQKDDVWCMTVPDGESFSLANGAVVHNCSNYADAFRQFGQGWAPFQRGMPVKTDSWSPLDKGMAY